MSYKRNRYTIFWCFFVGLMALLLSACGSNQGFSSYAISPPTATTQGTPKASYDQQVFRMPSVGPDLDVATLDPALVSDTYSNIVVSMSFDGLVRFDDNLQVQPELADSWSQSADGLQWIFHLRSGLTFSDGTPLTSKDVAYSIDRTLQKDTGSVSGLNYLSLIVNADQLAAGKIKTIIGSSILTPDANTIIFRVNKKASYFLYTLTYPTAYVVEKKLIDKYGNKNFTEHLTEGGGAGPFIVTKYAHKQEIDFAPNPYYYSLKPVFQKVSILFYASPDEAYQAYQSGQLDTAPVPPDRQDEAQRLTNEFKQIPQLITSHIGMNFLTKPFDNLHIRQAFALSINREPINNTIYEGTRIITYHIIPQGMLGYRSVGLTGPAGVQDARGNSNVAQQLFQAGLREEGWTSASQVPAIKFTYSSNPVADKIVNMIIGMWQNTLGVTVQPDPITFNTLVAKLEQTNNNPNGLQLWTISWASDYPDPQDWTSIIFGKGAAENHMNYGQNNSADAFQEQAVQQQLEQADSEQDLARRISLYQSAEEQLVNQVAWIPLLQMRNLAVLKPYVQGYGFNALGIVPPTDWANSSIVKH